MVLWCILLFKHETAYDKGISDWSSDVCSSDLADVGEQHDQQAADRIELAALHRARQTAEEGACATGDKAGEGEDDDLHGADPHAEGGGRELAVAHGGEQIGRAHV